MSDTLPRALSALVERSAAPASVDAFVRRLLTQRPDSAEVLVTGDGPSATGRALVSVAAASNALGRLCLTDPGALRVLSDLDHPVHVDADDVGALTRSKRLELLRIAARDLLGLDSLESVGAALSDLATAVLAGALALARAADRFAVIGMGKLGGRELNYASDVDVVLVADSEGTEATARRFLEIARTCFRVDADLRPEGRAGPLARSLDGYRSYWARWASTWEFQALLKARPVAGEAELGAQFEAAASAAVWDRRFSADELAELRALKARSEAEVVRRGLAGRELKRGPGGIRDIEFSVQLLQLVHGRHDPALRERSTLGALSEMGAAGYVSREDADILGDDYRFLRTVEHRIQLVEEEQTHAVPSDSDARQRLARVLGFEDDPSATATTRFDTELRRRLGEVRTIHERLFFRPLLESFATVEGEAGGGAMPSQAVAERLAAFGFADAARTRAAVTELQRGLTRSSRLMAQLLPLLLDWLSLSPDPDLGLIGLRNLAVRSHSRALMVATFRESPEAARRLCLLLGSSRVLAESVARNPDVLPLLDDDLALAPATRQDLVTEAVDRMRRRPGEARQRAELVRIRQEQVVRIAARDLLDLDDVEATGRELTSLAEALLESAVEVTCAGQPLCVIGMGRLAGREMAYASDLDVVLVWGGDRNGDSGGDSVAEAVGDSVAEAAGERLLHFMHGPSPAQRVATMDLGLRPEGSQGRLVRTLDGYATYLWRWAQTWERQALVRARVVAGDSDVGERFMALAAAFVWDRPLTEKEVADIRRMKARIERERIPARQDPAFHLKLGKGALADVEWTVQLLQLRHGIRNPGTVDALEELRRVGALDAEDAEVLGVAYRFCERTRNRWHLVGALPGGTSPGDALPTEALQLSRLARSLGTTPSALRDEYRRVTRRARRVVERVFYGLTPDSGASG